MAQILSYATNVAMELAFAFQYDGLTFYLKLLVLLYADDTVIFGTDENDLQNNIDIFYEYSILWHLTFNFDKTRCVIFGSRQDQAFDLSGHRIDICTDFKCLGVIFSRIGTYTIQRNIMLSKLGRQ